MATERKYEWTLAPGECERCGAYVPQLVRHLGTERWLCDECQEAIEEDEL